MNESVSPPFCLPDSQSHFFTPRFRPTGILSWQRARAQRWTHSKTLLITALADTGHVLATALLGLMPNLFGVALSSRIGTWFPRIAGALLIGLGLFYIWRQP